MSVLINPFAAGTAGGGGFGGLAAGTYYITRTIDHTKMGSENRSGDLVFCIDVTIASLKSTGNGGHVQHTGGADIHVTSSDGTTEYDFVLIKYDPTTGHVIAFVRPSDTVSSSSDFTYLIAYGDSSISSTMGSSANTFPASLINFAHGLDDDGSSGVVVTDRSANGLNATNTNGVTLDTTAGLINGGGAFARASNQYLSIANNAALQGGSLTIIATIITGSSFPAFMCLYSRQHDNNNWCGFAVRSDGKLHGYFLFQGGSIDVIGATALSASTRYVVTVTHTAGANGAKVYINGTNDATTGGATFTAADTSSAGIIGSDTFNGGRAWNGSIGEIWHVVGAKSAGWVGAHSNALYDPSTFSTGSTETAV